MKIAIVVLLFLFFAGMVEAKSKMGSTERANFKLQTRWGKGALKTAPGLQIQNFQRYIKFGKEAFPAASATYTHIVEEKKSESIKEIVAGIKIGFGKNTKWKKEKISGGIILKGDWKKATRLIRVVLLRPSPKEFIIFTSFTRKRYKNSVAGEIELMEKRIITHHSKAKVSFADYFIPQAYAQFNPFIPTGDPSQPNPYAALSEDISSLRDSMDQGLIEIDETQVLMQDLSDKWGLEMDELQALMQTESDEYQALITQMNGDWLERADRGLDIAEKFTDPKAMALVGFATAAGATLGSLAVNLLVDGVVLGVQALFELIFQKKANEERMENFNSAREIWEDQEQNALKLEQSLGSFLAAYEEIEKSNAEELLSGLQVGVDQLKFQSREWLRMYEKDKDCETCRRDFYQEYLKVERDIKKYTDILDFAKESGIKNSDSLSDFFCNRLEELKRKINKAEMDLNSSRVFLISGQAEWYRREREYFIKEQKALERINNQRAREENSQEARLSTKLLEKVASEAKKLNENVPDGWMEKCLDGSSAVGSMINAELPRIMLFRTYNVRQLCKEAYATIFTTLHESSRNDMDALLAEARAQAQFQYDNARFREIYANPNAEMQHIIDMEQWFSKLELEAECYGQMDQGSVGYKNLCKELSPQLVALRNANKKAHETYEQRCGQKWQTLQQKFIEYTGGHSEASQARVLRSQ